jgi:hypothetical protein
MTGYRSASEICERSAAEVRAARRAAAGRRSKNCSRPSVERAEVPGPASFSSAAVVAAPPSA